MSEQVDVVVVGLGPGGEYAAGTLAEAGLDVVGIEAERVGGECPYWGCVPSKMMIRAGNVLAEARRASVLAGDVTVTGDWSRVAGRIRGEATDDWNDQVAADRLAAKGVRLVRGTGRLTGPGRVAVGERMLEARRGVVLATGSRPRVPPVAGLASTPYWTNRDAVATKELPASMVVLGGGAIGVELAQVFARFGGAVTVVEGQGRLLSQEEPEAGDLAGNALRTDGVTVLTSVRVRQVDHDVTGFTVRLEGEGEPLHAERLLVATGRRVDLATLGVDTVGLDPTAHAVATDGQLRAGAGLWAVGDITGHGAFTHVSMYQAQIAVRGHSRPARSRRRLPGAAPGHLHRSRDRGRGAHRAAGPRPGPTPAHQPGADLLVHPRLDPRTGQRGVHQAGRGRRSGRPGRRDLGGTGGRRGAVRAERGRPRRSAGRTPSPHDLHIPNLPPGLGSRAGSSTLSQLSTERRPSGRRNAALEEHGAKRPNLGRGVRCTASLASSAYRPDPRSLSAEDRSEERHPAVGQVAAVGGTCVVADARADA